MGRRSRKRATAPPPPPAAPAADDGAQQRPAASSAPRPTPAAPRTATYKARREDAPQPAWAPFPLTELTILLSIIMIGAGFFAHGDTRAILLGGGFLLVTLSAGELSVREHFAGYRSHSSLLAGICAV